MSCSVFRLSLCRVVEEFPWFVETGRITFSIDWGKGISFRFAYIGKTINLRYRTADHDPRAFFKSFKRVWDLSIYWKSKRLTLQWGKVLKVFRGFIFEFEKKSFNDWWAGGWKSISLVWSKFLKNFTESVILYYIYYLLLITYYLLLITLALKASKFCLDGQS